MVSTSSTARSTGSARVRSAAHEHLRAADARPRCPADVSRHLAAAALAGEEIEVFGDGSQRRDLNYVDDAVARLPAPRRRDRRRSGEVYNLGGDDVGAADASSPRCSTPGRRRCVSGSSRSPRTARRSTSATTTPTSGKIRDELGWAPTVGLEEGLRRTLEYYREHGERLLGEAMTVPYLDLAARDGGCAPSSTRRSRRVLDRGRSCSATRVDRSSSGVRGASAAPGTRSASRPGRMRSRSRCAPSASGRATR